MTALHFVAHSGFGDCLHQRGPIRKLLAAGHEIWLNTPAPCIYHDLVGDQLHLVNNQTKLRTQAKNIAREAAKFSKKPVPKDAKVVRVSYGGDAVKRHGSVLAAMCHAFMVDKTDADFRMPVPQSWIDKAPKVDGPYILYRPPVVRKEWGGAATRNPDLTAYGQIFTALRAGYKVVSVADLQQGQEWIVGEQPRCDVEYHAGELDFEMLAALTLQADFVYTTPGVMTVLAQAVGVPCVTVFGGYECADSFSGGALYSPWMALEPINPCACWSHIHRCDKRMDVPASIERAKRFLEMTTHESRRIAELDHLARTGRNAGRAWAAFDRMDRLYEHVGADASVVGA